MRARRFKAVTKTPGLDELLRSRVFAGSEADTLIECRVMHWRQADALAVLIAPRAGQTGMALAKEFETAATQYYVELRALKVLGPRTSARWLQLWPAREGAPWPFDEDQFENVQMCLKSGSLETQARQVVPLTEALAGSALSVNLPFAGMQADKAAAQG